MSAPVFLFPAAADAAVGAEVTLDGPEARHAATVQRRTVGEIIELVDGAGARARGEISHLAGDTLTVRILAVDRDADPVRVLVQALAKNGRDEQAVEAATELGATRVIPWAADRSIVQWRGPKEAKGRDKWASLVAAATKQSRRATLPSVDPVVTSKALAALVAQAVAEGATVLVLHEEASVPLASLPWADLAAQPVWCIVGPEGGIGDSEVSHLTAAGARAVVLGPHVLRASSAGPAALAAIAALGGDWGARTTSTASAPTTLDK